MRFEMLLLGEDRVSAAYVAPLKSRIRPEFAGQHGEILSDDRLRIPADGLSDPFEVGGVSFAEFAADDHRLWIEHVARLCDDPAEGVPGLAEDSCADFIGVGGERSLGVAIVDLSQSFEHGAAGDDDLDATVLAATTKGSRRVDLHVADLAGDTGSSGVHPTVEDDPGTDSPRRFEVDRVLEAPCCAALSFRPSAQVRVVVDVHGDSQIRPDFYSYSSASTALELRSTIDAFVLATGRALQPDATTLISA